MRGRIKARIFGSIAKSVSSLVAKRWAKEKSGDGHGSSASTSKQLLAHLHPNLFHVGWLEYGSLPIFILLSLSVLSDSWSKGYLGIWVKRFFLLVLRLMFFSFPVQQQCWCNIIWVFVDFLQCAGGSSPWVMSTIWVVVDRLTMSTYFILMKATPMQIAQLNYTSIIRLYDVPKVIVPDRHPLFTSYFWHKF